MFFFVNKINGDLKCGTRLNGQTTDRLSSRKTLIQPDLKINNDTVAYSLKTRTVESQQPAVTRRRPVNNNKVMVFPERSLPCLYNELSWVLERKPLRFSRCELLLWEAGSWGRGYFGNPEERESPLLEAATTERLMKILTDWEVLMCPIVICEACRTVGAKSLLVVTSCKISTNPISNENTVYSH
jgi:hypothetical protein